MRILPMKTFNVRQYLRIGNIIPQNSLTLLTGLPGTGKSYSLLKFLNQNKVYPLWFNLDNDPALLAFKTLGMTSDIDIVKGFWNQEIEDITGSVVVIDTYSRLVSVLGLGTDLDSQRGITSRLLELVDFYECTLIIVGHPENYVGRSSIFKDNQTLVRDCDEHLHIDKIVSTGRKQEPPLYRFYMNKGRGIAGSATIDNWMR